MEIPDKIIAEFRWKIAKFLLLQHSLTFIAVWGFVWGTAVLVLRAALGTPRPILLWGLVGILPAVLCAVFLVRRHLPAPVAVRALLDRENRCGGLLMAEEEANIGGWRQSLPDLNPPEVRFHGGKALLTFLAAVSFVGISFLVPQRFATLVPKSRTLEISDEVAKLSNQIETLEKENIMDTPKAENFKKRLRKLAQESSGEDPAKTWEQLDHMENAVKKDAKEAVEKALQSTEQMNKTETLAKGLSEGQDTMNEKLLSEAMSELGGMVQKALEENKQVQKYLGEETQSACKTGSLTKEQLKQIAAAMQQGKQDISKLLEQLGKNGLSDLKNLDTNKQLGQSDSSGLAQFLEENMKNMSVSE